MHPSDHVIHGYLVGVHGDLRSRCTQQLRLTGFEVGIGDDALVTERGKLGQLVSYGAPGVIGSLWGVLACDGLIDRSAESWNSGICLLVNTTLFSSWAALLVWLPRADRRSLPPGTVN